MEFVSDQCDSCDDENTEQSVQQVAERMKRIKDCIHQKAETNLKQAQKRIKGDYDKHCTVRMSF